MTINAQELRLLLETIIDDPMGKGVEANTLLSEQIQICESLGNFIQLINVCQDNIQLKRLAVFGLLNLVRCCYDKFEIGFIEEIENEILYLITNETELSIIETLQEIIKLVFEKFQRSTEEIDRYIEDGLNDIQKVLPLLSHYFVFTKSVINDNPTIETYINRCYDFIQNSNNNELYEIICFVLSISIELKTSKYIEQFAESIKFAFFAFFGLSQPTSFNSLLVFLSSILEMRPDFILNLFPFEQIITLLSDVNIMISNRVSLREFSCLEYKYIGNMKVEFFDSVIDHFIVVSIESYLNDPVESSMSSDIFEVILKEVDFSDIMSIYENRLSILVSQNQIPYDLVAISLVTAKVEIFGGSDADASFLISFLDNPSIVVSHDALSAITSSIGKMKDNYPEKMSILIKSSLNFAIGSLSLENHQDVEKYFVKSIMALCSLLTLEYNFDGFVDSIVTTMWALIQHSLSSSQHDVVLVLIIELLNTSTQVCKHLSLIIHYLLKHFEHFGFCNDAILFECALSLMNHYPSVCSPLIMVSTQVIIKSIEKGYLIPNMLHCMNGIILITDNDEIYNLLSSSFQIVFKEYIYQNNDFSLIGPMIIAFSNIIVKDGVFSDNIADELMNLYLNGVNIDTKESIQSIIKSIGILSDLFNENLEIIEESVFYRLVSHAQNKILSEKWYQKTLGVKLINQIIRTFGLVSLKDDPVELISISIDLFYDLLNTEGNNDEIDDCFESTFSVFLEILYCDGVKNEAIKPIWDCFSPYLSSDGILLEKSLLIASGIIAADPSFFSDEEYLSLLDVSGHSLESISSSLVICASQTIKSYIRNISTIEKEVRNFIYAQLTSSLHVVREDEKSSYDARDNVVSCLCGLLWRTKHYVDSWDSVFGVLLPYLPVQSDPEENQMIYSFLCQIFLLLSTNNQNKYLLFIPQLFSISRYHINKLQLDSNTIRKLIEIYEIVIQRIPDHEQIIDTILSHDTNRIEYFYDTLEFLKSVITNKLN